MDDINSQINKQKLISKNPPAENIKKISKEDEINNSFSEDINYNDKYKNNFEIIQPPPPADIRVKTENYSESRRVSDENI